MGKKVNYPLRYEMKISADLKGKMEPWLIRWAMRNKKEVIKLKTSMENGNGKRKSL